MLTMIMLARWLSGLHSGMFSESLFEIIPRLQSGILLFPVSKSRYGETCQLLYSQNSRTIRKLAKIARCPQV